MMSEEHGFEADQNWHRVHWFRLVELLGRAVFASLLLLATGVPSDFGDWVEEAFGLAMGLLAVASYFSTRYRMTSTTVTATKGILFKSEESLLRADVQTVTANHPLWYRPLGLAVVIVADDAGNELEIGPVTGSVAADFAAALQIEGRRTDPGIVDSSVDRDPHLDEPRTPSRPSDPTAHPTGDVLVRRANQPIWKIAVISIGDLGLAITLLAIVVTGYFGNWLAAAAIALTVVPVPILEVVSVRRFQLTVDGDEIRVREGILSISESTTTRQRSEFLRIDEPLAFRLLGLERVSLGNGDDIMTVSPAQPRGEWRPMVGYLLGVPTVDEVSVTPISSRSVRRFRLRGAAIAVTGGLLSGFADPWLGVLAFGLIGLAAVWWYPQARLARFGLGSDGTAVITKESFAPRRTWVHRLDRIDATNLTSTPIQRRNTLATLRFSGRSPTSRVRIPDLDAAFATEFEHRIALRRGDRAASYRARRSIAPVDAERRDVALSGAGVTAIVIERAAWAGLTLGLWATLMIAVRIFDPPNSPWRAPWLLVVGTALVLITATVIVALGWRRAKAERWSLTRRFVEHRDGVFINRRTTVKRSHVSAAKWSQGPLERRFSLGSVTLFSPGVTNPDLLLHHLAAEDARMLTDLHRSTRERDPSTDAPAS